MPPLQDLDEGSGPQAACRKTSRDLRRSLMGLFLSKREAEACGKELNLRPGSKPQFNNQGLSYPGQIPYLF